MDKIPVPFSRTGGSIVSWANALLSVLTLKDCPSVTPVRIRILPLFEAETINDSALITAIKSVTISDGDSPAVEVTVWLILSITTS